MKKDVSLAEVSGERRETYERRAATYVAAEKQLGSDDVSWTHKAYINMRMTWQLGAVLGW